MKWVSLLKRSEDGGSIKMLIAKRSGIIRISDEVKISVDVVEKSKWRRKVKMQKLLKIRYIDCR